MRSAVGSLTFNPLVEEWLAGLVLIWCGGDEVESLPPPLEVGTCSTHTGVWGQKVRHCDLMNWPSLQCEEGGHVAYMPHPIVRQPDRQTD